MDSNNPFGVAVEVDGDIVKLAYQPRTRRLGMSWLGTVEFELAGETADDARRELVHVAVNFVHHDIEALASHRASSAVPTPAHGRDRNASVQERWMLILRDSRRRGLLDDAEPPVRNLASLLKYHCDVGDCAYLSHRSSIGAFLYLPAPPSLAETFTP